MDILKNTNDLVAQAITNNSLSGEGVDYAVSLSIVPDANGQPTMVTTIVLRMDSIVLRQSHTMGFFVNTPIPTEDEVNTAIVKALGDLRKMRDADMNIPQTAPDGSPSGLILK